MRAGVSPGDPPPMPRQIITLTLDGLTAADYIAHVADPEPPALGFELRSVSFRADPLGDTVEALLVWDGAAPQPRVAAAAAGLVLSDEVVVIEAADVPADPAERAEAAKAGRLDSMIDRAAARLRGRPWTPAIPPPTPLRWA
jgi:hypothetical protein